MGPAKMSSFGLRDNLRGFAPQVLIKTGRQTSGPAHAGPRTTWQCSPLAENCVNQRCTRADPPWAIAST
jgi:hypothetical protein